MINLKNIKTQNAIFERLKAVNQVVLCLTIFVTLPLQAENWDYHGHQFKSPDPYFNVQKIEEAIALSRSLTKIPDLPSDGDSFSDSQQTIPEEIKRDFQSMEKYYFSKNNQIALYTCKGCLGGMMPQSKSLFLDIDFFNKVKQEYGEDAYRQTYRFIIAHELGHFVQDIWTQKYGKSPNNTSGNSNLIVPDKKAPIDFNLKQIALSALSHGEVDMIGFKALSDLGYEFPEKGFKVLQNLLSDLSSKHDNSYLGFNFYSQLIIRTKVSEYSKLQLFKNKGSFDSVKYSTTSATQ